tara:strand:+ start:285 stop:503 length:219 start_codon:yes stop_codon:yes gene_type:complete
MVVGFFQLTVCLQDMSCSADTSPDCCMVPVKGMAYLHRGLIGELMSKQIDDIAPACNVPAAASTDEFGCWNA